MKKALPVILAVIVVVTFALALYFTFVKQSYPVKYREEIEYWANEYNVPRELVFAMIKNETKFDPNARSRAGAIGLMQLIPKTADEVAEKLKISEYDLYDAGTNIRFGTYYIAYLYRVTGSWENAVAAYNCGISRVMSWLADERYSPDGATLAEIPVSETRAYVKNVMRDAEKYKEILNGNK